MGLKAHQLASEMIADGKGVDDILAHIQTEVGDAPFTVDQSVGALAGATVDALILMGSALGSLYQALGFDLDGETLATRIATTFNLALASQLYDYLHGDGEEE